jgi:hypothetical protein
VSSLQTIPVSSTLQQLLPLQLPAAAAWWLVVWFYQQELLALNRN